MNHRRAIVCLLAVAFTLTAWGQEAGSKFFTNGLSNGRAWNAFAVNGKLSVDEKLTFLMGYGDALAALGTSLESSGTIKSFDDLYREYWPNSLNNKEKIEALDTFYTTVENRPIPIAFALMIVAKRASGTDEATLQKMLTEFRAQFNK